MNLTKQFTPDQFARGLESWSWIDIVDKAPVLSSLFGDVFFVAADGYWFLDTLEGTIERRWEDRGQLQSMLDSERGQDEYLLGGLAMAAHSGG